MAFITLAYLIGGLGLLVLGGDAVVRSAATLGLRFGLSPLATGLTIVAFGTSAPELVVNLRAASMGATDLAVGNVVGSNIANIGLVLGVSAMVMPLHMDIRIIRKDILIMICAGLLAAIFLATDSMNRTEGGLLVFLIVLYTIFNIRAARTARPESQASFKAAMEHKDWGLIADLLILVVGLGALVGGAQLFVTGAVELAASLGISNAVIGLTVVAVGTSLPELTTTAIAAYRGHGAMAIGNVVGSNIFNILSVLGLTAVIYPVSRGDISIVDLAMFLVTTLVLLRFISTGSRMNRKEGAVLFLGYVAYMAWRLW